ncbi:demethylmenaquinone methyltransferase [Sporomusaceae bacterium FL31]|nr:demethylmenaquinone methyltransferase [Sporomusaceae bacterium FL31]GCE35992.1 demethylmenaquinone methyltransferase [Sporomusaceae bacterium]
MINKDATQAKAQFVHRLFSSIANHYDFMNSLLSLNQDNYWRNCLLQQIPLKSTDQILDICCGTGKMTVKIAHCLEYGGKVVGLDFCEPMLAKAAEGIKSHPNREMIELISGDALALPFPDNTFNHVVTAFGLRNLPNITEPLLEMYRVVKPGGTVTSVELSKPSQPGLKQIYFLYFDKIAPLLGKIKVGRDGFYNWLPESLKEYPDQHEVSNLFKQLRFQNVSCKELTGGIATIHSGIK